jgi:hypothetical protein
MAVRQTATTSPILCRVSLADAEVGEELILVKYEHQQFSNRRTATDGRMLGCNRHVRLIGIRNEADFVSFMMQEIQLCLFRSLADPFDPGMKNNLRDGWLARRNFFHHALGMVAIRAS